MPQNPANKISEETERKRLADKALREGIDEAWDRQQNQAAEAERTQADGGREGKNVNGSRCDTGT